MPLAVRDGNELTIRHRDTQPKGGALCQSTGKGTPESARATSTACAKATDNLGVGGGWEVAIFVDS